ncbi:MAG: hypothetical protein IJZ73_01150 [Clostridia bacterium]|nr:hypothetical protein [Clostridia bacterium]
MKKFFYRVCRGDTLLSVCNRLNAPVFAVIKNNNITREIKEGDLIYIESFENVHKVLPFEDLPALARRLRVSEGEILLKNGNPPYFYYGLTVYL